jgi:parallel beta-helix repeat protein
MFYSSGNRLEGNMFRGFKYGLELWDKSDGNSISGNKIIDCNSSILINSSKDNKVTGNTLASTRSAALFTYNDGNNNWSSNYYSDWKNAGPRSLSGTGSDKSPLLAEPALKKAKTEIQPKLSDYSFRWDENKNNIGRGFITDNQLWKDKTVKYIWHDFNITDGGKLTLDNVTWLSPVMYNSEPEIYVKKGGVLILRNSRIVADAKRMPFYFQIEPGGKLIAENCTFENINELSVQGGSVTIRNCTFKDCYAISIGGRIAAEVTGCKVINSFTGIKVDDPSSCKLSGNVQTNVALSFREPQ